MLLSDIIKKNATKQEQVAAGSNPLAGMASSFGASLRGAGFVGSEPSKQAPRPAPIAPPEPMVEERATMSDAQAIASAIKAKMGEHRTEYYGNTPVHIDRDPDVRVFSAWGEIRINVGWDTGEDETESSDVEEWVTKLQRVLAPHMNKIKRVQTEAEEKGWLSTDIYLK